MKLRDAPGLTPSELISTCVLLLLLLLLLSLFFGWRLGSAVPLQVAFSLGNGECRLGDRVNELNTKFGTSHITSKLRYYSRVLVHSRLQNPCRKGLTLKFDLNVAVLCNTRSLMDSRYWIFHGKCLTDFCRCSHVRAHTHTHTGARAWRQRETEKRGWGERGRQTGRQAHGDS